ncbi:MAG: helix-turn-helix domain-containing protein [Rikenellaceae bacterium]
MSSKTEYPKVCAQCGIHFIAQKISTQYCSHKCSSRSYKQKKRATKVSIATIDVKEKSVPPIFRAENTHHFNPSDNNLTTLKQKEYLNVLEAAILLGVCRATVNNYCTSGKLKCVKMNRKIFIRRSDIDEIFNSAPKYAVTPRVTDPNRQPRDVKERGNNLSNEVMNTEFLSAKEAAVRFGVTVGAIHSRCRAQKVPWILFQGTRIYSATFLEALYKEEMVDESITEWYSTEEIMEVHSMTKSAVYSMVSEHKVPKKKNGAITLYSKSHVDKLIEARRGDTSIGSTYSTQDLFERYGLQPNYVRNFVYTNKIPRRKEEGKTLYSQSHFDEAIKRQNPPTVYLLIEAAAELFNQTAKHIYYLIEKHDIPTIKIDTRIRVQKVALDKIFNPKKLYSNGN